jgi:hypothetical protein
MHTTFIIMSLLPSFSFLSLVSLDKFKILTATESVNLICYKSLFSEKFKSVINYGAN